MSPDKLARMANQIATFFRSQPGERAAADVARHINDFWEPRMRSELLALSDRGDAMLDPLVMQAAAQIRRPDPAAP